MQAVVIDPDYMTQRVVQFVLHEGEYVETVLVSSATDGLKAVLDHEVDLVIIRAELPDNAAPALARDLRARGYAGPIVFLATKIDIAAKLAAFKAGADDYILEPVAPQELLARIQAVARRYAHEHYQPMGMILKVGDAELSVADLTLRIAGRAPVRLTPTEMRILECLMRNAGLAVNRETLIERVWGYDFFGESNRVDVYIRRLRHKIERDPAVPEFLHTVRGVGYNFRPPLERTSGEHALVRPEFGDAARELGLRDRLID